MDIYSVPDSEFYEDSESMVISGKILLLVWVTDEILVMKVILTSVHSSEVTGQSELMRLSMDIYSVPHSEFYEDSESMDISGKILVLVWVTVEILVIKVILTKCSFVWADRAVRIDQVINWYLFSFWFRI